MAAEFRRSLQLFYSRLQLASPYESVEKAIRRFTVSIKALPAEEQQRVLSDPSLRWAHYRQAFIDSGLNQKHRGIIAGLAQRRGTLGLPPEFDNFLDLYVRGK
ncbi:MAG TPA: hypothetical protein VF434_00070 [Promineifilum sp.]